MVAQLVQVSVVASNRVYQLMIHQHLNGTMLCTARSDWQQHQQEQAAGV